MPSLFTTGKFCATSQKIKATDSFNKAWSLLGKSTIEAKTSLEKVVSQNPDYKPAQWALEGLNAPLFDNSQYTFPKIKISNTYLALAEKATGKDISELLVNISSIDNLNLMIASLQTVKDTSVRSKKLSAIIQTNLKGKITHEDCITLIRIWCLIEDIVAPLSGRNSMQYRNVKAIKVNDMLNKHSREYPQACLIQQRILPTVTKSNGSCLNQCVIKLEIPPTPYINTGAHLYIRPCFVNKNQTSANLYILPEEIIQKLFACFYREEPIKTYFEINDEDIPIEKVIDDYRNNRHVAQIKPKVNWLPITCSLKADRCGHTRLMYTFHDPKHIADRALIPKGGRNVLIHIYDELLKEHAKGSTDAEKYKAKSLYFPWIDLQFSNIMIETERHGKLLEARYPTVKFTRAFVFNILQDIEPRNGGWQAFLSLKDIVSNAEEKFLLTIKGLIVALNELFRNPMFDLPNYASITEKDTLWYLKVLHWYLKDDLTFNEASTFCKVIDKSSVHRTSSKVELLYLDKPPKNISAYLLSSPSKSRDIARDVSDDCSDVPLKPCNMCISHTGLGMTFLLLLATNGDLESYMVAQKTGRRSTAYTVSLENHPNLIEKFIIPLIKGYGLSDENKEMFISALDERLALSKPTATNTL